MAGRVEDAEEIVVRTCKDDQLMIGERSTQNPGEYSMLRRRRCNKKSNQGADRLAHLRAHPLGPPPILVEPIIAILVARCLYVKFHVTMWTRVGSGLFYGPIGVVDGNGKGDKTEKGIRKRKRG